MEQEKLFALLEKFDTNSAVLLKYKEGDTEILLKKEGAYKKLKTAGNFIQPQSFMPDHQIITPGTESETAQPVSAQAGTIQRSASDLNEKKVYTADEKLILVKSPVVGTFYRSASPDAPAYVEKGTKIKKGQVLCIIEAMKMMNTLESEHDGAIEEILVNNGDLIEFDQPILSIRLQ